MRLREKLLIGLKSIVVLWLVFFFITFSAKMEAKAFNRFSKTQITWWDVLWADYRILPDK